MPADLSKTHCLWIGLAKVLVAWSLAKASGNLLW